MKILRPTLPKGYVDNPISEVAWEYVEKRLADSMNYWLCTVKPDGAPHVIPRWGVFLDGKLYYDGSPETRHARNLISNPRTSLHLESGNDVVIMDGESAPLTPDKDLAQRLAAAYCQKYAAEGYAPNSDQWEHGGLYAFAPRQCLAWTKFFENPTKFIFE